MYQSINELAEELEVAEHELLLFIKDNEIDILTLSVISDEAANYIQHVFNPSWISQIVDTTARNGVFHGMQLMKENIELLKKLLAAVGISNPTIEIETTETPDDMIAVNYDHFIFSSEEEYITGRIIHYFGTFYKPPKDDFVDRNVFPRFYLAAIDLVLHIASINVHRAIGENND